MNLNRLRQYYLNSPLWLKKLYSSIPFDLRNGKEYRKWKEFLEKEINIEEYELLKLKETISYAYENVPFYRKTFDKIGAHPDYINEPKDLRYLPTIDKEIINQNYNDFLSTKFPKRKMFFVTTGGTTGKSFIFYQSDNVWKKELAFHRHYLEKYFGLNEKHKFASFRGGNLSEMKPEQYWLENPIRSEIHFSPFKLSVKTVSIYVDKLNELNPDFIIGYYSSLKNLINFSIAANCVIKVNPKAVILISENINKEKILEISTFFNSPVFSYYAHTERIVLAPLLSDISGYEVDRRYGYFELLDRHGKVIEKENVKGEITGVSFDNYAMPLIRYKTGDIVSYQDCKQRKINFVYGRWEEDYLLGRNGERITLAMLNVHNDELCDLLGYQFVQEEIGIVKLNLIVNENFNQTKLKEILDFVNKQIGHCVNVHPYISEAPELTSRGKFKLIYNKIVYK